MAILDLNFSSLPKWTSSSISATGATTLVSAPAAGYALAIHHIRVVSETTTSGQVQSVFLDGTTASVRFWSEGISLGADFILRDLVNPWVLDTASALQFACTVSASSTPLCSSRYASRQ